MATSSARQAIPPLICILTFILSVCVAARIQAQVGVPPTIDVAQVPTPGVTGFTTYVFDVIPASASSISALDGEFSTDVAGGMRQVNPFDLPTVFNNNNGAIVLAGDNPLADSQFGFNSHDATLILNDSESGTDLRATLAGLPPLSNRFTLAHVVLADGVTGIWQIALLQTDAAGASREYLQSGVFGSGVGGVTGDYNANGEVDAADYALWRNTLGSAGSGLAADGNKNELIDPGDYDIWRANFGRSAGDSTIVGRSVPEPATAVMLLAAMAAAFLQRTVPSAACGRKENMEQEGTEITESRIYTSSLFPLLSPVQEFVHGART